MASIDVVITPSGQLRYLQTPETVNLFQDHPAKQVKRISHVEPINVVLRVVFRILRISFSEYGKVAAWTRLWPCRWQVNFAPIGGKLHRKDENGEPFQGRRQAIDFEIRQAATYQERVEEDVSSIPQRRRKDSYWQRHRDLAREDQR